MWVRPNMAKNGILNDDNAPAHAALSVAHFFDISMHYGESQPPYALISHLATSFCFKK
jgi:hypothetical protein